MANVAANKAVEMALVKFETSSGMVALSPQIIRQYLVNGNGNVTDQEVMMFLNLCRYQKLNPFLREAYLIKYGNTQATMVTGKETFTKRADRNENYDGFEAGVILEKNGVLECREGSLVLKTDNLVGGWANVFRKDRSKPFRVTVTLSEYMILKDGQPQAMWKKMPGSQIRKVALVGALREAFPEDFGGMYSPEEMPIDDSTLDAQPVQQPDTQESPSQGEDKTDQTSMKSVFSAIDSFCKQHPNYDQEVFVNLAKDVLRDSYKVDSLSDLTTIQWKAIRKNVDKLIEKAESKYVEDMFADRDMDEEPPGDVEAEYLPPEE